MEVIELDGAWRYGNKHINKGELRYPKSIGDPAITPNWARPTRQLLENIALCCRFIFVHENKYSESQKLKIKPVPTRCSLDLRILEKSFIYHK